MRFPSFLLLLSCLLGASLLRAAEFDPKNVQIFQRDATGRNKPIDMLGSSYPLQAIGFDANGILGPLDVLTQDEWTAQLAVLTTALGLKANLASPNLTGTPTAPTAAPGTNTTQLATTAFATVAVNTEAATRAAADVAEAAARAGADAAEAATRATIDANKADLFHTHVAAEIVDGGAVGLPLLRSQTAAEARGLIGPFVVADGDKGDITVSGTGATYTIDSDTVTMAKLANIAGASLIGRSGAGTGDPEPISVDPSYFTMSGASLSLAHVAAALIDSGTLPYARISPHVGDTIQAHSSTLDELATGAINSMLSANGGITLGGPWIVTPTSMAASTVIDVLKPFQTQQASASVTSFTFSTSSHSPGRRFTMKLLGDVDGITARTITIPASNSDARDGASITTFLQAPAPAFSTLTWVDTGTAWDLYGDPGTSTGKYVIANGKTATINNSITLAGTDGTTLTLQGTGTVVNRDSTDTLTNKTLTSPTLNTPTVTGPTYTSASISALDIDWATATSFYKTLSANSTFTFSNVANGRTITVALTNTASNYTVTWPTVSWSGGSAPTQTTGAKTDVYTFIRINGVTYGSAVQNF